MFSGMFTHCIKPALTAQQAKELFALLGYQPAGSNEEELRLGTKPVNSHALLQLACGFFIARIECQLLLTAVACLGGSMEWVLQLIQERKRGCTFQIALDSAKRKLEPAPCDSPLALDATLDLYTDDTLEEHSHMASPPSLPYIPPSENPLACKMSRSNTSQSNKEKNEKTAQTVSISSLTCQIKATPQKTDSSLNPCENETQFTAMCNAQLGASKEGQHVCNCLKSYDSYLNRCLQCEENHSMDCACIRSCIEQGHEIMFIQQHMMDTLSHTRQDQIQQWEKLPKDDLKQHSCINKPSNNYLLVCHDCHYIHDIRSEELQRCSHISRNVQTTGRLQPAQVEQGVTAHTCFKVESTHYVVCHTCNKSYDFICNELQSCHESGHYVRYLVENNENTTQAKPMPLHQCCTSTQPKFACLTCRVFHATSCDDNQCQRQHEVQSLKYTCSTCSGTELYVLCRYCCAQYCKNCWFKNPLECKCGMPFDNSAV